MSSESSQPPSYVIEAAQQAALRSPCAKSKRGVVLFNRELADQVAAKFDESSVTSKTYPILVNGTVVARGFNGQPDGFNCSGSEACRRDCAKLCLHAEQRAIWKAGALDDLVDLELVHVKVENGEVVPGGGPSCWQCSRLIVEVGLRGVWLFEGFGNVEPSRWRYYTPREFHLATLRNCDLESNPQEEKPDGQAQSQVP